jgi:GNAT superfamily N-acetyltransferase
VTIRLGIESDVNPLLALFDAVAAERVYIGTEPGYDRELYARRFREMIARPEQTPLFVAVSGDMLVGQLGIFQHAEYGPTIGMMVAAQSRGRGVGRALLDKAIDWARRFRMPHLSLLVFSHNERAVSLYEKAGFVEIERYERDVTRQSGEVWDTLLMRKEIA